jgi:hypothetical protein
MNFIDAMPRLPTGKHYNKPLYEKYWAWHGGGRIVSSDAAGNGAVVDLHGGAAGTEFLLIVG